MIENEVSINGTFRMRINFNLKGIGSQKSQIWLTTTINKERVRIYTQGYFDPEFWIKTIIIQFGERVLKQRGEEFHNSSPLLKLK